MRALVVLFLLLVGSSSVVAQTPNLQIPTSHPRVWWTPQRLTQARAWYAQNGFTPSSSDYVGQAFRYLMTGEAQYARSAINHAVTFTMSDLAANSSDPNTGVASDGARWEGEIIILTYDWCYDQMTAAERTTILNRWNTYIDNLRKKPWGGPTMPQSNYYWGYLRNELEWGIATWYENQPLATTFVNHALTTRWQNSFVPHATSEGRGGVLQEGSAYGRALVEYATVPLFTTTLLGRNVFAESNFFQEAVYAIIYGTTPGRTALKRDGSLHWEMFPFADDERFIDGGDAEAASWANFMAAAAAQWSGSAVGQYARRWMATVGYPAARYIQAVDPGGTQRDFSTLPLDYYSPGPGFLYGRNAWGAQSTAFHLQLSETYDEGHRHDDSGNWQIWRKGRWLSRESTAYGESIVGYGGSGSVDGNNELAHNTFLVNRRGFARAWRNGRPVIKRVESRPTYAYAAVDLTPAFRNTETEYPRPELDNAAVARVEREYVFVRPLETMVIFDRAQSTDATSVKTFLAHFERAPVADGANSYLAVNGDQALRVTTLLPSVPVSRIVNEGGQVGQYRLEVETSGTAQSYLLHVLQGRDATGQNLQSQVTDAGDRYVLTLQHPTLGSARLEFMKGAATAGGGIAYSATGLPTSVSPLLSRVQSIQVTASGPVWEVLGGTTPPPMDTTAPTISAVTATAVTSSGATVTWTTNEAADRQVEYGSTVAYGQTTTLNTALSTLHSVNLTGLAASTPIQYRVRSRDAAGNLSVSGNFTFTTAAPPATVTYTLTATAGAGGSINPSGSVVVTAGTSRTFTIAPSAGYSIASVTVNGSSVGAVSSYTFNNVNANGTISATFATITQPPPGGSSRVTGTVGVYSGNGPANLVSNGIPFKPGALTNARNVRILDGTTEVALAVKVLAVWPQDSSIRALLVQFIAPVAKTYTIEIGTARTTPDIPLLPVNWDVPQRILTLPAQYLSESLIFWEQKPLGQPGFAAWDSKQLSNYSRIETLGTSTCANTDQYYDSITTTYQMYARTGDARYLVNGRRWALHHRRDQVYLTGSLVGRGICADTDKTRYVYPQGLVQDYFMFGDEEAKRVSGLIADNFFMTHPAGNYYIAPNARGFWTEREPAFALIGLLAHYEATNDARYLTRARERVTALYQMQIDNGRRAWVHNLYDHDPSEGCSTSDWGSSPSMSGLLLEGVIKYYKLTADPIARSSFFMAVDDLRARYVATGSFAGRSFKYLGCPAHVDGNPDLDNLIAHAYGYAYKLTGTASYRDFGMALFNTAVVDGFAGASKQYNQHFRSSGHFVAYVAGASSPSDSIAPTVSITAPASAATISGNVNVTANATDNRGVAGVQFLVDGQPHAAEDTVAPYALTLDSTTLTNGSHTIAARARDAAGNIATSTALTVTVSNSDTTQPSVAVTSPAANATVTGTINLTASASDNVGVVGVQFLVDGQTRGAEDTVAPYSLALDSTSLTSGSHTISARARDAAGNTRISTAVPVTVNSSDTTRPIVAVTSPAANATVTGTVGLAATASDNVGVVGVQFLVDGQVRGAEDTLAPYALTLDSTTLTNGSHMLAARARDAAGNTTTSTAVSITVNNGDSTRPTVAVTSPAANATVVGTITVTATATDNVGVVGVQFLVDGQPQGTEDTVAPYAWPIRTTTLTNGSHTIAARARDVSGNITTSTAVTVTVNNTADSTAPTVTITSPTNGQTISGIVNLNASATDAVGVTGVQFLVDAQALGAEDTVSPYTIALNTSTLSNGSHVLAARARDAAGNTRTTQLTITVANGSGGGSFTPIRINSGGSAYTDPRGGIWAADTEMSQGYPFVVSTAIANTSTPLLYRDQLVSSRTITYTRTVPNGTFNVRLLFAEIYHSASGRRVFDVRINGVVVASRFDIFTAAGGRNQAIDQIYPVSITNGSVMIEIVPVVDDAVINGLEITAR